MKSFTFVHKEIRFPTPDSPTPCPNIGKVTPHYYKTYINIYVKSKLKTKHNAGYIKLVVYLCAEVKQLIFFYYGNLHF